MTTHMHVRMILAVLLCAISMSGCTERSSTNDIVGRWFNEQPGANRRVVELGKDGRFEALRFPSAVACSDDNATGDVDGRGTWEYLREDNRVFLKFSELSDKRCTTPYGTGIFWQSGDTLWAYPDVDLPSTAIVYKRDGNT